MNILNALNLDLLEEILNPGESLKLNTLYSKDNKDKIKVWNIRITALVGATETVIEWGAFNGKQQVKPTRYTEGKNIGRANQTTHYEQAVLEAKAQHTKQRERKGYFEFADLGITKEPEGYRDQTGTHHYNLEVMLRKLLPVAGTTKDDFIKPMLAKPFWKDTKAGSVPAISFPCLAQPKLNGVRCIASFNEGDIQLMSREGVRYRVAHVEDALFNWYSKRPEHQEKVFDGELYIHKIILADIVSAVKKPNLLTPQVTYEIYDVVDVNMIQRDRLLWLMGCMMESEELEATMKIVPTKVCRDIEQADALRDMYIQSKYEGAIFRHPAGKYEPGKRSSNLVKYKKRKSGEFMILGVRDSDRDPGQAIFVCRNDINHSTFDVVPQGNDARRRMYYNERVNLVGKMLTVEYYERTAAPDSLPFHTTGIAIRDYE